MKTVTVAAHYKLANQNDLTKMIFFNINKIIRDVDGSPMG